MRISRHTLVRANETAKALILNFLAFLAYMRLKQHLHFKIGTKDAFCWFCSCFVGFSQILLWKTQVPTMIVTEMGCKHLRAPPESLWARRKIIPISQKLFHLSFGYERRKTDYPKQAKCYKDALSEPEESRFLL